MIKLHDTDCGSLQAILLKRHESEKVLYTQEGPFKIPNQDMGKQMTPRSLKIVQKTDVSFSNPLENDYFYLRDCIHVYWSALCLISEQEGDCNISKGVPW